jgi:hypothetical protein
MTKEQAIALAESEFWKEMSYRERATFQLFEELLCMPFEVFHEAVEKTLGRPVFSHEFGMNWEGLKSELIGAKSPPTIDEILNMIPEEKRIVMDIGGEQ